MSGFRLGIVLALLLAAPSPAAAPDADPALTAFRRWLDSTQAGYGCDEGPARFRSKTVETAYPDQHFCYVLTYTRGIPPSFEKSISLVAAVDDSGHVIPFRPGSPSSYSRGLMRIRSSKDARLAAAAVSILASCDPGQRRWRYDPDRFRAKKKSGAWTATYEYEGGTYSSWVSFDRSGNVAAMGGSAPPVP